MAHLAFPLTFVALALTGVCTHAVTHNLRSQRARSVLSNGMQPEVVARTLASVEEEWKAQAAVFVECNETSGDRDPAMNCAEVTAYWAPNSFAKSCSTVVAAIVQGSSGERNVAKEYMGDVCEEPVLRDWLRQSCLKLAVALDESLTADAYENRVNFDGQVLCGRLWSGILEEEKKRVAEEKAEQEEQDRKAEAAAKKASGEREAAQAKIKAVEAAARMAQKRLEAENVAEAANKAMEEAAAAGKRHQELDANAKKTNSTIQLPSVKSESSAGVPNSEAAPRVVRNVSSQKVVAAAAVANTTDIQPASSTK